MKNEKIKTSCKNVFKHKNKEELTVTLTEKWAEIIKTLEQTPKQSLSA